MRPLYSAKRARLRYDGTPWSRGGRGGRDESRLAFRKTRTAFEPPRATDADERLDLLMRAQELYDLGYTVVASWGKRPTQMWKNTNEGIRIGRFDLFDRAKQRINEGKACSLTVRLDGDLAAVDLDFNLQALTDAFMERWTGARPLPVMVRGMKGGKILVRLKGKAGIGNEAIRLRAWSARGVPNALEVKTDLSAVYGEHSAGVRYGPFGDMPTVFTAAPGDLPEVTMGEIEEAYNGAIKAAALEVLRQRWGR